MGLLPWEYRKLYPKRSGITLTIFNRILCPIPCPGNFWNIQNNQVFTMSKRMHLCVCVYALATKQSTIQHNVYTKKWQLFYIMQSMKADERVGEQKLSIYRYDAFMKTFNWFCEMVHCCACAVVNDNLSCQQQNTPLFKQKDESKLKDVSNRISLL